MRLDWVREGLDLGRVWGSGLVDCFLEVLELG